jgi:hypothetical protein
MLGWESRLSSVPLDYYLTRLYNNYLMNFRRYSAIDMFGVPLEDTKHLNGRTDLIELMDQYGIEPQAVSSGPLDITPYYWRKNNFRYMMSLPHPEGPIVVDLLPVYEDSEAYLVGEIAHGVGISIPGTRHIEIPTTDETLVIAGGSPRFAGQLCMHELVTYFD